MTERERRFRLRAQVEDGYHRVRMMQDPARLDALAFIIELHDPRSGMG